MTYYVGTMPVGEHLSHHGIKGMRWGQRRYQNPDGSLTAAGRVRYGVSNVYGRARSGVRSAGNRTSSWYKKNKKTIKRVAAVAGTAAAVAGTAYLGKRYGKSAVRAAKRLGRAAPFKVRAVGNKARTMYAKGVVNARHFGQSAKNSVRSGFGNVKRTAAKANFNSAMRKQAKATAKANASSTLSRYGSFRNRLNRGINNTNDFFKGTRGAIKRRAKSVSDAASKAAGATGDALRGAGYHARRAGAKMKNAARSVGYKAGNAPYFMKRTAQRAGGAAKNAVKKTSGAVKNAAKKAPGAAKKYYKKTHGTPAGAAYNAVMGAAYYGHARKGGASRGQAAAVGVTRAATGRILPAHAVGVGVRTYNSAKRRKGMNKTTKRRTRK